MSKLAIIIPAHKDADIIDFCLESLQDQDFQDFTVTLVNDGRDEELEKRITSKIEEGELTFKLNYEFLPENKGASAARNLGYDTIINAVGTSKPKYLFFLDSDCMVKTGILQNMVDILDKEDIDFIYGDYEYTNGHKYTSRPFNPYTLRTMNYISTMSMMRTDNFARFNEELDYFQDWDLFYRMVKAGSKGYYLKETIFLTEPSVEGNISGINIPLKDKCKTFREVNNIEDSSLVVTTFGCPLQAEQRAEILNADYAGTAQGGTHGIYPANLDFDNWTHTYIIGGFNHPVSALKNHLEFSVGKPIIHFVGTDVFQLWEKQSPASLDRIKKYLKKNKATLLVNSERLQKEMKKMGIKTELLYTPLYKPERFIPTIQPAEFTVAVYYSDTPNMNFFNTQDPFDNNNGESNLYLMWEVAKAMPNVKFKFFGGKARFTTANVEFCGKIPSEDMPEFINSCSTIVRTTIHDSLPHLPLQFMLSGRRVITSSHLPFADIGLSFQDILHYEDCKNEVINKIMECKTRGGIGYAEQGLVDNLVYEKMSQENYVKRIKEIMEDK